MFDQLSDRLQDSLSAVRSRGKLTEADVDRALRARVLDSLNPGQQVVKIVHEELATLMGSASRDLARAPTGTTVILMAGLQGSGKTTACAKLAMHLAKDKKRVALAACDTQRPA